MKKEPEEFAPAAQCQDSKGSLTYSTMSGIREEFLPAADRQTRMLVLPLDKSILDYPDEADNPSDRIGQNDQPPPERKPGVAANAAEHA